MKNDKEKSKNSGCLGILILFVILALIVIFNSTDDNDYSYNNNSETSSESISKSSSVSIKYSKVSLNVRKRPNGNSRVLKVLKPNEKVTTKGVQENGFTQILDSSNRNYGWCATKYLQDFPLSESQLVEIEEKKKEASQRENSKSNSNTYTENYSLARKLAVVERGTYVKEDDILVKRFDYLLKSLDSKYVESKTQICDISTVARNQLLSRGVNANFTEILEGMNRLNDKNDNHKEFKEYATIYVIIRKEYVSHSKTINEMQLSIDLVGIDGLMQSAGLK
jgi:hypothetical protein